MKHSISRRNVVKGAAWATPMVVASASVPAFASSLCTPGITLDVPTNTTTNGDSVTHTFTAGNIEVLTFTLLGGAGGTYQGNARDGHGGSGALVTGTLDLNPTDEVTFIIAGGGGPYNNSPSTPGKGWADGGSHSEAIMDENEYTKRYKEHSSKSLINELYGPTGGGASAILLNGTPIAIAGGGGGAGARQISRTSWNKEFYGPQPESFKGLKFNTGDMASGGSGGRVGERGGSYQETYLFFPGPALNMNGGLGGGNGQGGAGAPAGSLSDPKSNSAISFEGSQERYLFSQNVAGNAGADATLTKNSQGNNGGQGGAGVVGIGMAITWYRTSDLNQCSILHGSTGGGGYGGGGSASVTTAAGYGADQSYASVTGWVDGNYIEGGYWSPVGSAAFSGAGGGGGSYVDPSRVYDSNITTGSNIGKPGMRVNGAATAVVCRNFTADKKTK